MVKFYSLMVRRPGWSREDFQVHWRTVHAGHARKIRRIRRYVQSHSRADPVPGIGSVDADGIAEVWFDDLPSAVGLGEDPDYLQGAYLDDPNFIDLDRVVTVYARELAGEGGVSMPGGHKVIEFVRRDDRVDRADFERLWPDAVRSAPTVLGAARQRLFLTVPPLTDLPADGEPRFRSAAEEVFSAVHELWWDSDESFAAALADRQAWAELRPPRLVDAARSGALRVTELPILPPGT